eukprot:07844.XXX_113270_113950_1 [CDS] Oithona nana genome sequencing.
MKSLIVFSALLVLATAAVTKDLLHAECTVKWTVSVDCAMTQQKIVDQMNAWDNEDCETKPDDTAPHGQKCLYKHTGSEGTTTYGTHTTPIQRYVDDLTFNFQALDNGGCFIDANSISETLSLLDFGTNYCNLFNLMDGSGLAADAEFTEDTNDYVCTQRSSADCDIY